MVEIALEYELTSGEEFLLRGRVRNVGDAVSPTLLCELDAVDAAALAHVGRLKLRTLPAAPLPLYIARAIESATKRPSGQPSLRKTLERAGIRLFVGGQERLDFVCWRMYDELEDEVGMLPAMGQEVMTPWRLARRMLERASTAWPSGALQSMPAVTKNGNGVEFCRASELPGLLGVSFSNQFCLAPQPFVENVHDAYFATDVARFLSTLGWGTAAQEPIPDHGSSPSVAEPETAFPDLTVAMRRLHELGLADGDVGYFYWHRIAQLLQSSVLTRKRLEELEQRLASCSDAKSSPGRPGRARRRS